MLCMISPVSCQALLFSIGSTLSFQALSIASWEKLRITVSLFLSAYIAHTCSQLRHFHAFSLCYVKSTRHK